MRTVLAAAEGHKGAGLVGTRVLYAGDDEEMRRLVQDVLEDRGVAVTLAADGREALDLAVTNSPDVIISDLRIREGDLDYVLRLRRAVPEIPIIVVTALGDDSLTARTPDLDPVYVVNRPVRMGQLAEVVDQAANRRLDGTPEPVS